MVMGPSSLGAGTIAFPGATRHHFKLEEGSLG